MFKKKPARFNKSFAGFFYVILLLSIYIEFGKYFYLKYFYNVLVISLL